MGNTSFSARSTEAQPSVLDWLLAGDPAIAYQACRDLVGDRAGSERVQPLIAKEGWGARYLAARRTDGHWGRGFYQPKWTSTHYTLLDLANLGLPRDHAAARESVGMVLAAPVGADGGINYARTLDRSDICINGMILSFAAYFRPEDPRLAMLVDHILFRRLRDGAWNCQDRNGSITGSLHSTLSVIEGLHAFRTLSPPYRRQEIDSALGSGAEFILSHRLYKTRKTGAVIDPRFTRLTYPWRWRFDVLRALDFFGRARFPYDQRMTDGLEIIRKKRRPDGRWRMGAAHPGAVHFTMEGTGQPSRWITLLSMRVLLAFQEHL